MILRHHKQNFISSIRIGAAVDLPVEHLTTFAVIVEEGSFESAARRLHVTPSAISQRVRGMEQRVGTVLLRRTRPVAPTEAGEAVLRAARQVERIVDDVSLELDGGPSGRSLVPIAVNSDSLATWFMPALARAARETGARFELLRSDETVSAERLRSGEAMAALTATAEAVPGCVSSRIGAVRYRAVAAPGFAADHFAEGVSADSLRRAPVLDFDRHDQFQNRFIRKITRAQVEPPRHFIPSSAEFTLAIELGMGWGMLPERQAEELLAAGRLVELAHESTVSLPLYWQRWNLRSPVLDGLSRIVAEEAATALGCGGRRSV